jgi:coenzyme F420-0:L-glutamate ligase/coenzyme F420-1:gamma-L-glutamate ligase
MTLHVHPLHGIPEVGTGDDVAGLLLAAMNIAGLSFEDGDVLVVTHKVVSKAEGRVVEAKTEEDYRAIVESEAVEIIRRRGDLVIAQTRHGFICANAGVDRSNTSRGTAVLLPVDPDRSAHRLRTLLERATGTSIGLIISDTFGRPWRRGLVDIAIGVSGLSPILDMRGKPDSHGRIMEVTEIAVADEIAAAADLVMGKADQVPAALVRGLALLGDGRAADLVRPAAEDLFR